MFMNKEKKTAKRIVQFLNKRGFIAREHHSKTSKSIYIKIDNCSILCNDLYGKNIKKWIYVYVQLIHFAVHLKLTQHYKSTMLQ